MLAEYFALLAMQIVALVFGIRGIINMRREKK